MEKGEVSFGQKMERNKRLLEKRHERLKKKRHLLENKMTSEKTYLNTWEKKVNLRRDNYYRCIRCNTHRVSILPKRGDLK